MALNLAKRPFVDTRPANALTAFLVLLVLGLSAVSWRTFHAYMEGSRGTQAAIAELRREITRAEEERKSGEARLSRYDVADLGASAEDANAIAQRRAFSWTRFLSHLEETLPYQVRLVGVTLARTSEEGDSRAGQPKAKGIPLELQLVSRDPLGLPKTIRAFYSSRWFDMPVPRSDDSAERGTPEGRTIVLGVTYLDEGRSAGPPSEPAKGEASDAARSRTASKGARR